MKNTFKSIFIVVLLLLLPQWLVGQSQPTRTTLSSAMTAPNSTTGNTMVVGSATGITASTGSLQQFCLIENEMVQVRAVSGTTITVARARNGVSVAHASGATVICGYSGTFNTATGTVSSVVGSPTVGASVTGATFVATNPVGSCTRSSNAILPVFFVTSSPIAGADYGYTVDCLGGSWVSGALPDRAPTGALTLACNVPVGSVAYASFGTSTAGVSTQEWTTSIYVPRTAYVTGIKVLSGATSTTDKILAILRDSAGNAIANAAVAGVVLSGASTFQTQAFTAPRLVVGPAKYFIGVQTNGATAGDIMTIAAATFVDVVTTALTGQTFGTIVSPATMPTTFTATVGPIACIYY